MSENSPNAPQKKVTTKALLRMKQRGDRLAALTACDHLMADIRAQGKKDGDFQANAPQRVVSFPAGAAWLALTDLALHGAVSGRHSLDQTFFLPADAMRTPARSSLRTLERLTGRSLEGR